MDEPVAQIRSLAAGDAESLVALFERCYGGTYVDDTFHDAGRVADALAAGRMRSVVAVQPTGEVVGHMGLTPREGALVAELGNTVVDPRCRGQSLAGRLSAELMQRCVEMGLVGFLHYPTTAHAVMQRLAAKGGGVETGVLLDYIPAETDYAGFDEAPSGRVAVVAAYHALAQAPTRTVRVPLRDFELLRSIYERASLSRQLEVSRAALCARPSRLATAHEPRRGMLRIELSDIGEDVRDCVARACAKHASEVALVDLPLADGAVAAAADALAPEGFRFGALLPEYAASGDVLRLQRTCAPAAEPLLETSGARALYEHSLRDRSRVA